MTSKTPPKNKSASAHQQRDKALKEAGDLYTEAMSLWINNDFQTINEACNELGLTRRQRERGRKVYFKKACEVWKGAFRSQLKYLRDLRQGYAAGSIYCPKAAAKELPSVRHSLEKHKEKGRSLKKLIKAEYSHGTTSRDLRPHFNEDQQDDRSLVAYCDEWSSYNYKGWFKESQIKAIIRYNVRNKQFFVDSVIEPIKLSLHQRGGKRVEGWLLPSDVDGLDSEFLSFEDELAEAIQREEETGDIRQRLERGEYSAAKLREVKNKIQKKL